MSLSDEVASRLRAHGLYAGAVQITVKDAGFKTITRQTQLASPTHLAKDIAGAAVALLRQNWRFPAPIRMLTVTAPVSYTHLDVYKRQALLMRCGA